MRGSAPPGCHVAAPGRRGGGRCAPLPGPARGCLSSVARLTPGETERTVSVCLITSANRRKKRTGCVIQTEPRLSLLSKKVGRDPKALPQHHSPAAGWLLPAQAAQSPTTALSTSMDEAPTALGSSAGASSLS